MIITNIITLVELFIMKFTYLLANLSNSSRPPDQEYQQSNAIENDDGIPFLKIWFDDIRDDVANRKSIVE